MKSELVYLVLVRVYLLGGQCVSAVDVFEADDAEIAAHMAHNSFLQASGQAVVYGNTSFFPDTVMAVDTEVLAVIDATHEFHGRWAKSLALAEDFAEKFQTALGGTANNHEAEHGHFQNSTHDR